MAELGLTTGRARLGVARHRRLRIWRGSTERKIGLLVLLLLVAAFILVPALSTYGTRELSAELNAPPSLPHLFGTDNLGRDLFTRSFAGGLIDVAIAGLATAVSLTVGTVVGVMIGLTRNRLLVVVALRLIDSVLAIPFVILVLSLVLVLGPESELFGLPKGVGTVVLAVSLVDWAVYARIARSQALVIRDREFVEAARLLRYSKGRILLRHVLPNVFPTSVSYAATDAILIIISIASLAFLGSGVQEPTPELGNIMYQGHSYLATSWWITVLPGMVLVVLGASLAFVADSFRQDD
jgi:peptide/nickel transport system permease protein